MDSMAVRLLLICAALLGAACRGPHSPCGSDSECQRDNPNSVCDTGLKQCVAASTFCSPACSGGKQCISNTCEFPYSAIQLTAPADNTVFDGGTTATAVPVTAHLVLRQGATATAPSQIDLQVKKPDNSVDLVTLTQNGDGDYTGSFSLGAEGIYQLTATYSASGVSSTPVNVRYDKTAPVFAVTFPVPTREDGGTTLTVRDPATGYENAWRRDETVTVTALSNANDVVPGSVQLVVYGVGDGGTPGAAFNAGPMAQATTGCDAGYCGTYTLNLWDPQLKAFRGQYMLAVSGTDTAGNVGQGDGGLPVTRWKWAANLGSQIKDSPAIGSTGKIYLGVTASGNQLVAVRPNGSVDWSLNVASPILASPAVAAPSQGRELVFFGTSGTGGKLAVVDGDAGTIFDSCSTTGDVEGGIALESLSVSGQAIESGVTILNSNTAAQGRLIALRPDGGADTCRDQPNVNNLNTTAGVSSVVANGGVFYYGDELAQIDAYQFNNGSWSTKPGWSPLGVLNFRALAISSDSIIGAGKATVNGGVVAFKLTDGSTRWQYTGPEAWNPVVTSAGAVEVGFKDNTLKGIVAGDAGYSVATTGGAPQGSPALGEGGYVYSANIGGAVQVWKGDSLIPEWEFSDTSLATDTSVALDCARDSQGTKAAGVPGVLYVAASNGKLFSFVVDSRGIDTTAPWPKYQHDPRNTGNAQTPLSQFACP